MKTLDQLIHERHEAFQRAAATNFQRFSAEWREANQAYVAVRNAQQNAFLGASGSAAQVLQPEMELTGYVSGRAA